MEKIKEKEVGSFFLLIMEKIYWGFIAVITILLMQGSFLVAQSNLSLGILCFVISLAFGLSCFLWEEIEEELNAKIFSLTQELP